MSRFDKAQVLLQEFKGDTYVSGMGVLPRLGGLAASLGTSAALIHATFDGSEEMLRQIQESLARAGVTVAGMIEGARPNSPREDVYAIADDLKAIAPDVVVSFGGGSTIDAAKAGVVLSMLGGEVDDYFGTHLVTKKLEDSPGSLTRHVAMQTLASSGAHLTKYSNITDLSTGQKKLIVDEAIVPQRALFDYELTLGAPHALTVDGGLDGVAHCLEVLYGAVGQPNYDKAAEIASTGIGLIVDHLPRAVEAPQDRETRRALGLGTDLGGYAIMIGGTNGGHLTSFSLVDILSHGRACAVMNPYYTVFFAPAIEKPLRLVADIYRQAGREWRWPRR